MPINLNFPSEKDELVWSLLGNNSSQQFVKFTNGDSESLQGYSSSNGEFLYNNEKEVLFLTDNGEEISLSNFKFLNTEQERMAITSPLTKLYLVKETGKLWFWDPVNLWWMLLNTGEAKTKNVNAYTLIPASSIHTVFSSSGASKLHLSILNSPEEIYLSLGNSSISVIISQTANSDNSYFAIYRYNENTNTFHCIAYTDLIENLFSSVGRKRYFFSHINEQVINTNDLYYLGILSNTNGGGILGNPSTVVNNALYMNCFIDNITKIDFTNNLETLNGEGNLQVNPIGQAILLTLSSYKNE